MKAYIIKFLSLVLLSILGAGTGTINSFGQDGKTPISLEQHHRDMEILRKRRDSTLTAISKLKLSELVRQMNEDSRAREHFNSTAYREVSHHRQKEGKELYEIISNSQRVGYISFMALRKIDMEAYHKTDVKARLNALAESFRQTKVYNRWGIPHLYWQAPAKSLIELGKEAEPVLKSFLKDRTNVLMMGHEEELEIEAYKYRKCDYALAMIMAIRGQNVKEIPGKAADRDQLIKRMLEE